MFTPEEPVNLQGETYSEWLTSYLADYESEYGDRNNHRSEQDMLSFWEDGWDFQYIEEYEAWRDREHWCE